MNKKGSLTGALLLAAALLCAQDIQVRVYDKDLDFPLEGVKLELTSSGEQPVIAHSDADGTAILTAGENFVRGTVTARYPGYATVRIPVESAQRTLSIAMSIQDVIDGQELVVERTIPGKTDEKPGVSLVMEKRDMDTISNLGLVEDVMSSIKTLPGVGFAGAWNATPSIRGGYPDETATVMDGVYLISPWHWGGGFSIFNPNMVQSAKMSHGVFSVRYGRAVSGLLEIETVSPSTGNVRFDGSLSTTSCDIFTQIPLGSKAGIFLGGKVTWLETMQFLNDTILDQEPKLSETIPTMPYIRDFYTKLWWRPDPTFEMTTSGFFGSDGVGIFSEVDEEGINSQAAFDWLYLQSFGVTRFKWLATDSLIVQGRFAGSWQLIDMEFDYERTGGREYSQEFLDAFPDAGTSYTIDGLDMSGVSKQIITQYQGKLEADKQLNGLHSLGFGSEAVIQTADSRQKMQGWQAFMTSETEGTYLPVELTMNIDGNRVLNTGVFALWNFGNEQTTLSGEAGLRGDHFYLWNTKFNINTLPVASPRLSLSWKPAIQFGKTLDSLTLTAGTGLFSVFPVDSLAANEDFGIESFDVGPNRTWFQVVGAEVGLFSDWLFRIEGFYKHYFNRLYVVAETTAQGMTTTTEYTVKTDGMGYTAGFDLLLRKKSGRYFDGYLSYSFVYSQFKNPLKAHDPELTTMYGEPLNQWYFPDFHRFHSANLILNWRPFPGLTATLKTSIASGKPRTRTADITMHSLDYNGNRIEQYERKEYYDSKLRTGLSCPVDLRVSWSNYFRNSKIRWEQYIGIEDIFVNLYKPKSNSQFDPYTGKEIADSDSADFNIGIPILSVGYKVSY